MNTSVEPQHGTLDAQHAHWERMLAENAEMFGGEESDPARVAAARFKGEGVRRILELGGGQGRDTLFLAREGFDVTVLDYAESGAAAIREKSQAVGLGDRVTVRRHDVRRPFPALDGVFDACFSHMLFCMALVTEELRALSAEVRRILRPGGLCIYTARHTGDAHFGAGIPRGEDIWEHGGFIVHFFSREKVALLAEGWELLEVAEFEEGGLPRKLFRVTMRKGA